MKVFFELLKLGRSLQIKIKNCVLSTALMDIITEKYRNTHRINIIKHTIKEKKYCFAVTIRFFPNVSIYMPLPQEILFIFCDKNVIVM